MSAIKLNIARKEFGCILFLILCCAASGYGQTFTSRSFTVNNGLPSNQVYDVFQEQTGKILAGTEYGLVVFDGEVFKSIPFEETSNSGSTVLGITKDKNGRIWIQTYRDGLFFLHRDTLRPFAGNHLINRIAGASTIYRIQFDKNSNLWFTIANKDQNTVYRIDLQGKNLTAINPFSESSGEDLFLFKVGESSHLSLFQRKHNEKLNYSKIWKIKEKEQGISITTSAEFAQTPFLRTGVFINNNSDLWFSRGSVLHYWNRSTQEMQSFRFIAEIICLKEDAGENILVGTRQGAYILNKKNGDKRLLLKSKMIHQIFQDNEYGYWIATTEGLFYFPSLEISLLEGYGNLDFIPSMIDAEGGFLAVADADDDLYIFGIAGNEIHVIGNYKLNLNKSSNKKILFKNERLFIGNTYFDVVLLKEGEVSPAPLGAVLDMEIDPNGAVLYGYKRGFSLSGNQESESSVLHCSELFCTAVWQTPYGVFVGTDRGLYKFTHDNAIQFATDKIKYTVSDIKGTSTGSVVISTRGGGIFIFKEGGDVVQVNTEDGLASQFCGSICIENDSTFWVASNRGLNRINYRSSGTTIDNWYLQNGLASDNVIDLALSRNLLFVLTDKGINYFNPEEITAPAAKISLTLDMLKVDGEVIPVNESIDVKPGKKNILLEFKVNGFKTSRNIQLRYVLSGNDQFLSQTSGNNLLLSDLAPGYYTLEVEAIENNSNGIVSAMTLPIYIRSHYYETGWFLMMVTALILLSIAGGAFLYFKFLENSKRRKWEYNNAQLEALNLQMNPHFIFNALNSIQYLSFTKEHKLLNQFISNLSGLMRSILDHSKVSLVSLSTELKNIEDYLQLEMMRLEDKSFYYKIVVDEKLDLSRKMIPPMLVQPLVENAIWHGLQPKDQGEKKLEVRLLKNGSGFKVEVQDNGIGINKSVEHKKRTVSTLKPSLGLNNISKRLQLYENLGIGKAALCVTDLSKTGSESGTLISMSFLSVNRKKYEIKIFNN